MALAACASTFGSTRAHAQPAQDPQEQQEQPVVDVVVPSPTPPRRLVTIEYNPLALVVGRISANVEIVPLEHHGIILSPFYFNTTTPTFTNDAGQVVLSQNFKGFGGEIGYRYYSGREGPRGWFVGPSFVFASVEATAGNGTQTSLSDYGVAVDVGYQAIVAARWVVSLGGGGQYTFTGATLPSQQMPANIYANAGLHPRILFALGYAF
jgi:hypothetical protein